MVRQGCEGDRQRCPNWRVCLSQQWIALLNYAAEGDGLVADLVVFLLVEKKSTEYASRLFPEIAAVLDLYQDPELITRLKALVSRAASDAEIERQTRVNSATARLWARLCFDLPASEEGEPTLETCGDFTAVGPTVEDGNGST